MVRTSEAAIRSDENEVRAACSSAAATFEESQISFGDVNKLGEDEAGIT